MPELPEVETVRRGLNDAVLGVGIDSAVVRHPRAVRRQPGGAAEFRESVAGTRIRSVRRRGKYLMFDLESVASTQPQLVTHIVAHLGMSGQFRIDHRRRVRDDHARALLRLDDGRCLVFRDQRTFGWVVAVRAESGATDATPALPWPVAHIAPDPFEESYDAGAAAARMTRSASGIKRLLLAQTIVSGIGNIYADEALWSARVHPDTPAADLGVQRCAEVLSAATSVMSAALAAGGTSFDPLYVAVNGESGWFERSLQVYGREGLPCSRCGSAIVREKFTNRSSHRCPVCQPAPPPPAP